MSDPRLCRVSTCDEPTAVLTRSLSPEFLARHSICYKVCPEHAELTGVVLPPPRRKAAHPAYERSGLPEPTCYGAYGTCPNDGALFASGVWCPEHAPK